MYYLNYSVCPDIEGLVQAKWPDIYTRTYKSLFVAPEYTVQSYVQNGNQVILNLGLHDIIAGEFVRFDNKEEAEPVLSATGTTITLAVNYDATDMGNTLYSTMRFDLPGEIESLASVTDISGFELERGKRADTTNYWYEGTTISVPPTAKIDGVIVTYNLRPTMVTSQLDQLPYNARYHRDLLPILNYGATLAHFRDRRKAEDMKVFYDLYEQAKSNIAVLSVMSL